VTEAGRDLDLSNKVPTDHARIPGLYDPRDLCVCTSSSSSARACARTCIRAHICLFAYLRAEYTYRTRSEYTHGTHRTRSTAKHTHAP